jgi:transcriptional regulator with PAS, ATPase and Fis domain
MQPKLLRVIEDKEFERVGGTKFIQSDFRIIAATNRNLDDMINAGDFRKDLFYRLNVIPLKIPPLRERKSDIVPLARYLLNRMVQDTSLAGIKIDREVDKAFKKYGWPGNVRELSNVLERALSALEGDTICLQDLPFYLQRSRGGFSDGNQSALKDVQARTEKEAIRYALKESKNNKAEAARVLGIHRTLLYKKMKKYNLPLDP